jgi:hypothetical protein
MSGQRCETPIGAETLADYWIGELGPAEEESVEQHLLGCDSCCERLREAIALTEGIRRLARGGGVRVVVSRPFLDRLAESGLRVREYAPPAGGSVACAVTPQDDLLVACLAADLKGARRVDISLLDEAGRELERLRDIPVGTAGREVLFSQRIDSIRAQGAGVLVVRLLAVEEQAERLLGEYTFRHTPS